MDRRTFIASATLAYAGRDLLQAQDPTDRPELPFRQVHLDFHTSELITDVARDFDADEFVRTLQQARVNSVNLFAKCHHGMAYWKTEVGHRHPHLQIDLMGEMIRALKSHGIRANYYYSLVWDVYQFRQHPEWLQRNSDGSMVGGPLPSWPWMCMNSPYLDVVAAENQEIVQNYDIDGVFFDILKQPPNGCFCQWCVAERKALGLSDSADDIFKHNKIVAIKVEKRLNGIVLKKFPQALTFYNSRVVIGMRDELPYYSHMEIESLPTGGWGYTHFQQRVRYLRTLGKDMVGMTGRFHKSWGDFGGLKNQAALDFECLNFLANGTKVCVGDQLHPRGRLDPITYQRIGRTYAKIEALEPYAKGAKAYAEIGVISTAATNRDLTTTKIPPSDQGFTNMLVELHHQFNVLDLEGDYNQYKLLILPDEIIPNAALTAKLKAYLKQGGSMIVSHESLLDPKRKWFSLDELGVVYQGKAQYKGEYMALKAEAFPAIDQTQYFLYQDGSWITATPGTEVLATYAHPYFDRTAEHWVSHKQTPVDRITNEPFITKRDRVVYIANPFFRSYSQDAFGVQKQVVQRLIEMLLPEPKVKSNLPSTAQVTVLEQQARTIVHVLHYPLTRRAPDIDIIEEPGLLADVDLQVRMEKKPSQVTLVPGGQSVAFTFDAGYVRFRVPRIVGHQAILLS